MLNLKCYWPIGVKAVSLVTHDTHVIGKTNLRLKIVWNKAQKALSQFSFVPFTYGHCKKIS